MGTPDSIRSTNPNDNNEKKNDAELFYQSFNMSDKDKTRLYREFYYPPRISASGNYYPRYKVQGDSQTGTSHVSYLSRPYFNYLVPSCYRGYSKYVYVTKIN